MQARIARLLQISRLAVMVLALGGVALHIDASAADPLAPKAFWFAVAAGLLPALTALRLWWGERLRLPPLRLGLALLAWAGAVTAAYSASPLREVAQGGWQAWLLSAVLLLSSVDLFADDEGRAWLLRALTLVGLSAGAWCLAERLGWDPSALAQGERGAFGGRVAACFGNPNFAGGFFVLLLPLLVHQALAAEKTVWRWLARVATVLAAAGLLLSAGKAALLGAAAAAAVAGHLIFWSPGPWLQRKRALAWLGMALLAGFWLGLALLPTASRERLLGGPDAWSTSVRFRQLTWAGTVELVKARPWTGWGPGTFSAVYPPYRPVELMADQVQHAYEVTRPEDWPLELAAEAGLLGLAAGLALLGLILWPLRALARGWATDPGRGLLALALLASLLGSLACNLASLDLFLPSTLLPFVLLLGLAVGLAAERAPAVSINPEGYARLLVSAGLAVMASAPMVQAQAQWQASRLLAQAEALSRGSQFDPAIPRYQLALQLDPPLAEARYFLGCSLQDRGGPQDLSAAAEAFSGLAAYAPDYVQLHARLGRLWQAQGRVPEAAQEYEAQLRLDPWDLGTLQQLATLYAGVGRLAEAEQVLAEGALRWPDNGELAHNLVAVQTARRRLIANRKH